MYHERPTRNVQRINSAPGAQFYGGYSIDNHSIFMTNYDSRNFDECDDDPLADWTPPGTLAETSALIPPSPAGHNRCVFRFDGSARSTWVENGELDDSLFHFIRPRKRLIWVLLLVFAHSLPRRPPRRGRQTQQYENQMITITTQKTSTASS